VLPAQNTICRMPRLVGKQIRFLRGSYEAISSVVLGRDV
jgi:hypothetical protein